MEESLPEWNSCVRYCFKKHYQWSCFLKQNWHTICIWARLNITWIRSGFPSLRWVWRHLISHIFKRNLYDYYIFKIIFQFSTWNWCEEHADQTSWSCDEIRKWNPTETNTIVRCWTGLLTWHVWNHWSDGQYINGAPCLEHVFVTFSSKSTHDRTMFQLPSCILSGLTAAVVYGMKKYNCEWLTK